MHSHESSPYRHILTPASAEVLYFYKLNGCLLMSIFDWLILLVLQEFCRKKILSQ